MRRLIALAALMASSSPALADEGELALDLTLQAEAGVLTNPLHGPLGFAPMPMARPRLGAGVRYGVTDAFYLGVQLDGGMPLGPTLTPHLLVSAPTTLGRYTGDLHSVVGSAAALLTAGYRLDFGWNYSGVIEAQVGPAVAWWAHQYLAVPGRFDAAGNPVVYLTAKDLPLTVAPGALARIQTAFEMRLFDLLLLAIGPHVSVGWAGGFDLAAGITLRGSLIFPRWFS